MKTLIARKNPALRLTAARNKALALLLAASVAGAATVRRSSAPPPMPPGTTGSSYNVLLTRSIFSKDHNRPAVVKTAPTTRPEVSSASLADANFLLNGVAIEDDVVTAFFEQTADHTVVRARTGETIARGVIGAVTLDGVDYVVDGKPTHVGIGQSLDGGTPVVSNASPGASASVPPEHPAGEKPSWWRKKSTDDSSSSGTEHHKKKKKDKAETE
jgi:hypothetical protein